MPGIPKYRLHRASGLGVVRLGGRDHYLGKHGTAASRAEYLARIAEWEAADRRVPDAAPANVADLAGRYAEHAATHYVKRGRKTSQYRTAVRVAEALSALYGNLPVGKFGVTQFKAIRHAWIAGADGTPGLCRKTVNDYSRQLGEVFRWGVEEGIVPVAVIQAIKSVRSLPKGRSAAPEPDPVTPAPVADVEAVLAVVRPRVAAKIRLQLLTGMRPGEVCSIRTCDIDRSGPVWVFTPYEHKTEHKGKARKIPLGPRAQSILAPFLDDSEPDRHILVCPSSRRKGKTDAVNPGTLRRSYQWSVGEACVRAGVPHWFPNQLRHNAATELRKNYGIEAAQMALGHSSVEMTEIYAEKNLDAVVRIAAEVG